MSMSLRSSKRAKRVDYASLAGGSAGHEGDGESSDGDYIPAEKDDKEKMLMAGSRNESGEESLRDGAASSTVEESYSEEEMEKMEQRLKDLKATKKKLEKKERHRVEMGKANNKVRELTFGNNKRNKSKHKLDINSLRSMDEVMKKVDKLMEKNVKFSSKKKDKKRQSRKYSSSEDSDSSSSDSSNDNSSCSSSSSTESESDDNSNSKKKNRRKSNNSRSKSKKDHKKRSGKTKKLTTYVKYPQEWPHAHLSLHFVNQQKKYEDLSIQEFCAGYVTILENSKSKKVQKFQLRHFKDIMYLATRFQWKCVLNFHAAVLLEIERGHVKWGDNFQMLQTTTLAGGILQPESGAGQSTKQSNENPAMFCRNFQKGTCGESTDHFGDVNGVTRFVRHICANCWLQNRKRASHPETSELCPLKES